MLWTTIDAEFLEHGCAKLVFRQHALYRFGNDLLRRFFEQFLQTNRFQIADIARVMVIYLVFQLVAGHPYLGRIDHNDVIPGIDMRREYGLVLAAQTGSDLGRQAAQRSPVSVHQVPVMRNLCGFGRKSAHTIKSKSNGLPEKPPGRGKGGDFTGLRPALQTAARKSRLPWAVAHRDLAALMLPRNNYGPRHWPASRRKCESVDVDVAILPPVHVPLENPVTNSNLIIASYVELGVNRAWVIGEQKTYVLQR